MESGSDDEFFDAEEELSPKKLKSPDKEKKVKLETLEPKVDIVDGGPTETSEPTEIIKQIKTTNISNEDDIITKDAEIIRLQEFGNPSNSKQIDNSNENVKQPEKPLNSDEILSTLPGGLTTKEDNIVAEPQSPSELITPTNKSPTVPITDADQPTSSSKSPSPPLIKINDNVPVEISSTKEDTQMPVRPKPPIKDDTIVPVKPKPPELPPQPIAPPRKKRQQRKEVETGEVVKGRPSRPPPPRPPPPVKVVTLAEAPPVPCIKVSSSTTEMNQVLESGNSLEVVYNDDQMARKSGGILSPSSSTGSPTSTKPNLSTPLTDAEILEQVIIKNLDTGETIPLSLAEERLPKCTNPLALHILRLATEEEDLDDNDIGNDDVDEGHLSDVSTTSSIKVNEGKRKKLKKFFGKTVQKIKSVADEVTGQGRPNESSSEDEEQHDVQEGFIKFKNHRAIKDRLKFRKIKLLQDLSGDHMGAVWTMKFSLCGKLLATAGQDNRVRVWVLKEYAPHFEEMRLKYSKPTGRSSPTGSMTSHTSTTSADDDPVVQDLLLANADDDNDDGPFKSHPFVTYHGHTSDVLDLSWSKNYFILSSSMDKTVRLWHISRSECLCCFQHVDFVTAICFHPRDDRYFLSGSLDGKIRLWNIPEKKVALWNEIDGSGTSLITAANFCQDGKLAVVGTYDGRCIFYDTERLKYHTQVTVRSSRGKNARGRKISGIEPMPNEDKVLITSNDSRIRLYDLKDHSLYCKYKGLQNESSQIRASFSHDGQLILCGSEDKFVHIWHTNHEVPNVRKDRNEYYESFSAHDAVVTAAIFAPYPNVIMDKPNGNKDGTSATATPSSSDAAMATTQAEASTRFEVLVAADWQGGVKFYINR